MSHQSNITWSRDIGLSSLSYKTGHKQMGCYLTAFCVNSNKVVQRKAFKDHVADRRNVDKSLLYHLLGDIIPVMATLVENKAFYSNQATEAMCMLRKMHRGLEPGNMLHIDILNGLVDDALVHVACGVLILALEVLDVTTIAPPAPVHAITMYQLLLKLARLAEERYYVIIYQH